MEDLLLLQEQLLDSAARTVRPGGILVYSLCSIEDDEGREQASRFTQRHPDYVLERIGSSWVPPEVITGEGFLLTLPHVHGCDGAFAARFKRVG